MVIPIPSHPITMAKPATNIQSPSKRRKTEMDKAIRFLSKMRVREKRIVRTIKISIRRSTRADTAPPLLTLFGRSLRLLKAYRYLFQFKSRLNKVTAPADVTDFQRKFIEWGSIKSGRKYVKAHLMYWYPHYTRFLTYNCQMPAYTTKW